MKFLFLLLIYNFASIQFASGQRTDEFQEYSDALKDFKDAESFFFDTLRENFCKSDLENTEMFFKYLTLSSANNYVFKLQVNTTKFKEINLKLESKYCNFFPFHYYDYNYSYKDINFNYIKGLETSCDTLQIKVSIDSNSGLFKESPLNVHLTNSFKNKLIYYDGELEDILEDNFNIVSHVELLMFYRRLLQANTKDEIMAEFQSNQTSRRLLSLLFWKYISYCANYDLEVMKYTYEN